MINDTIPEGSGVANGVNACLSFAAFLSENKGITSSNNRNGKIKLLKDFNLTLKAKKKILLMENNHLFTDLQTFEMYDANDNLLS